MKNPTNNTLLELVKLLNEWQNWVVKENPNYTDNDFDFTSFCYWIKNIKK